MNPDRFIFVVCQRGAENACKKEMAAHHPESKFAFSRPGFLTFKFPGGGDPATLQIKSTFARTWGWSLGDVHGETGQTMAQEAVALLKSLHAVTPFDHLHVWQRDANLPGELGFEPFLTPLADEVAQLLVKALEAHSFAPLPINRTAKSNQRVCDVILIEPNHWWIGWHPVGLIPQRWPGGVAPVPYRPDVISRAYYKVAEAIAWSRLPLRNGDVCLELGSAPGGAAQWLLERGLKVIAIDPADLDPHLADDPNLLQIRKRSREVQKRDLADARWLFADMNVAPNYTLDAVEEIATSQHVKLHGIVLTLKLPEWSLADHIDNYRERVKSWGFKMIRTRQLAFNRHEFCLAALKNRFETRSRIVSRKRTKRE